jgi:hypothetical protein
VSPSEAHFSSVCELQAFECRYCHGILNAVIDKCQADFFVKWTWRAQDCNVGGYERLVDFHDTELS